MTSHNEKAVKQPLSNPTPPSSDATTTTIPSSPLNSKSSQQQEVPTAMTAATNPRLAALTSKQATLTQTLNDLQFQISALVAHSTLPSGLAMPTDWSEEQRTKQALEGAKLVIKEHIALLHKYNEMKDIGQGLMGLIAEQRGVRVAEVMEGLGVGVKD